MNRRNRLISGVVAGVALSSGTLTGCGLSVYDVALPGGPDMGDHPIHVVAYFDNVADLVPQSSVKLNFRDVGQVKKIEFHDYGRSAKVTMLIRSEIPGINDATTATVQQTSLLGEKYVNLITTDTDTKTGAVTARPGEALHDNAVIDLQDTKTAVGIEEVLGGLSALLNGGGIAQFKDIYKELEDIYGDRPDKIKGFMTNMRIFVKGVNDRKQDLVHAIEGLDKLATALNNNKAMIEAALTNLTPGIAQISAQRTQLVTMLKALTSFSDVANETLRKSGDNFVANLKLLDPILDDMAKAGRDLPRSLEVLLTFPFPNSVKNVIWGDYLNVIAHFKKAPASGRLPVPLDGAQSEGQN